MFTTLNWHLQVNNVQAQVGHREIVEIFCTWNQFYHSGRGGNRSEAEQEAAKVMLMNLLNHLTASR